MYNCYSNVVLYLFFNKNQQPSEIVQLKFFTLCGGTLEFRGLNLHDIFYIDESKSK